MSIEPLTQDHNHLLAAAEEAGIDPLANTIPKSRLETMSTGEYWMISDENHSRVKFYRRLDANLFAEELSGQTGGVVEVIKVEQRIVGLYEKGQRL